MPHGPTVQKYPTRTNAALDAACAPLVHPHGAAGCTISVLWPGTPEADALAAARRAFDNPPACFDARFDRPPSSS